MPLTDQPPPPVPPERTSGLLADYPSLQERIYQILREAILRGDYAPGERLYEGNLARILGVSRVPVREAIRRLQQVGLIEARARSGIFVASFTLEEVDEVYRIRAALEGTAAALAAEKMTDGELDALGDILAAMEAASSQGAEIMTVGQADRFHLAIHRGARSRRLTALLEQIYLPVSHFRNLTLHLPGRASAAARGHHDLVAALRRRDAALAERLMREHIDGAREALLTSIRSTTPKVEPPDQVLAER